VRELALMSRQGQHQPLDAVMAAHRVWPKRKPLINKALKRSPASHWEALLRRAGHLDQVIKGQALGNAWDELLQLSLAVAGLGLPASVGENQQVNMG
jgi:DNA polymerase-3 subunit delta